MHTLDAHAKIYFFELNQEIDDVLIPHCEIGSEAQADSLV
jgi:hypothetical protein